MEGMALRCVRRNICVSEKYKKWSNVKRLIEMVGSDRWVTPPYLHQPCYCLWSDHPGDIWWRIWILKLIMQFSPSTCSFVSPPLLRVLFSWAVTLRNAKGNNVLKITLIDRKDVTYCYKLLLHPCKLSHKDVGSQCGTTFWFSTNRSRGSHGSVVGW
jgi:hypothetical protein